MNKEEQQTDIINDNTASVKGRKYAITTILLIVMVSISGFVTLVSMVYFRHRITNELRQITAESRAYDRYYALVVRDAQSPFWMSAYDSMKEQGENTGVYVDMAGSNLAASYGKPELMEMAIASKVDGIIYEADDSMDSLELINKAVAAGIPVVTVRTDAPASARRSFIGVSYYSLGTEYGKLIIKATREILKGREEDDDEAISVLVLTDGSMQDTSQNVVLSTLKETVQKIPDTYPELIIGTAPIDNSGEFTAEESVRDLLYASKLPDIIVCLNEVNTESVYQTIVEMNKVGDTMILGYDDSDAVLGAVEKEVVYATITVDTQQLGQDCVDALNEYIVYKHVSDYYGVDYKIINKNNVDDHLDKGEDNEE
ncbi:MAG: substrate-binding domain-containing protein [Lachnospiraceae bacterium]|nr:substrate-binding domain-containing protein [Lachnospiraceae bacterium]